MSTSSKENLPAVWYADVPRSITRQVIFGLTLLVVAFGGFGTWAFRAPLAAAIIAQGSFVATGRNKIVQHLEGGIIKDILIKEGDTIQRGDVIMSLDETAAEANERELFLRQIRLEATAARLLAQYNELREAGLSSERRKFSGSAGYRRHSGQSGACLPGNPDGLAE